MKGDTMQVTCKRFEPCLIAIREAGYDVQFYGSKRDGTVNLSWRARIDVSDKAEAAGRRGVRKASGFNQSAAKTAWQDAVKHATAKPRRRIRTICRQYGFPKARIQLINTMGDVIGNIAALRSKYAGNVVIIGGHIQKVYPTR